MSSHLILRATRCALVLFVGLAASCDRQKDAPAAKLPPLADKPSEAVSVKVEALTGAHTRVVWAQYHKDGAAEPYLNGNNHLLMGLDTRDGLGVRALIKKKGNHSRPLLSTDGATILFTDKNIEKDDKDRKKYKPVIYRTDWLGSAPVKLSKGYAVDTWIDPATKIEWVYAVRDIVSSTRIALEAKQLFRFPLNEPAKEELVWDKTRISPDNIQFSRDGVRACGQFPWPNLGQFVLGSDGDFKKLTTGCWPGMAPDNSYVSWALDGSHRQVAMFADDGRSWNVNLAAMGELAKGETYHPRWSNHPRFMTLTGPYLGETVAGEGSVIGKGGTTAEVYIAKFTEALDKFESVVRITDNQTGDAFPDVWIAGGDQSELAQFSKAHSAPKPAASASWPVNRAGLVFLWEDRNKNNTVRRADGRLLDCSLETNGAARYGRQLEMLLDAGSFMPKEDAAHAITDAFAAGQPIAVEFVLALADPNAPGSGIIATLPGLKLSLDAGVLKATTPQGTSDLGKVTQPITHLVVNRTADGQISLAGAPTASLQAPGDTVSGVSFGGGGIAGGLRAVAIYARAVDDAERQAGAQRLTLTPVPPAPRVKLRGKLVEASPMPTEQGINPYTSALVEYIYEVTQVLEGSYSDKRIFVKHWGMLDRRVSAGFPRQAGQEYELLVEPLSEHPELRGDRSMELLVFDLDPWYDVTTPTVGAAPSSSTLPWLAPANDAHRPHRPNAASTALAARSPLSNAPLMETSSQ